MSSRPVIVAGCGRSGSHLIGHIMAKVFGPEGAAFEPADYHNHTDVVVDSRLRRKIKEIEADGHRIVHLVRDGRDVVRSLIRWYGDFPDRDRFHADNVFRQRCAEWRDAVDQMMGYDILHLEDLNSPEVRDQRSGHKLPHWTEWDDDLTRLFWNECGAQMEAMGYKRE
jgi:hypothetical protein